MSGVEPVSGLSESFSAEQPHVAHRGVDDHELADEDDADTTPTYIRVEDLAAHGAHASEISKLLKVRSYPHCDVPILDAMYSAAFRRSVLSPALRCENLLKSRESRPIGQTFCARKLKQSKANPACRSCLVSSSCKHTQATSKYLPVAHL